jgi:hypothetical protein
LRSELRPLTRARLLRRLAAVRPARHRDVELRGTLQALRTVARRVQRLTAGERELAREIETLTRSLAPQLLDQPGVGPLTAAQLVISWSHRGRIRSEAAFARLAGCAPIPASSGQTIRHRLDRSGDRQLNRALHMIIVTRRRAHPPTIAYIEVFMDELVFKEDSVEYHWTFTGTSADTGKRVRIAGFEEWTIGADGLIGESLGHYDQAEYDRQLHHGVGPAG